MDEVERSALGRIWLSKAQAEHASVGAFARFVLHLLKLSAPPELLLGAIRAMEDEVHHAQLAFGVAARFRGVRSGPGEFDIDRVMDGTNNEATILSGAISEGCVEETVAVHQARIALERCQDENIRGVLGRIVDDELQHAELSWRFAEWMTRTRPHLAGVAREAFARATEAIELDTQPEPAIAEEYGHLNHVSRVKVRREVVRDIIAPRASAMMMPTPPRT